MKTLINLENLVSLYLFEEDEQVVLTDTNTVVGSAQKVIIGDCNSSNSRVYSGVTAPEDWVAWKYMFIEGQWVDNPEYPALKAVADSWNNQQSQGA